MVSAQCCSTNEMQTILTAQFFTLAQYAKPTQEKERCRFLMFIEHMMMLAQSWSYVMQPKSAISQRNNGLPTLAQRSHAMWADMFVTLKGQPVHLTCINWLQSSIQ